MQAGTSITRKLGRLVLVSVALAMFIGSGASLWLEAQRYGAQKRDELLAVAHVFAAASAGAVAARDREAVFAAISAIDELAGIEHVEVRDLDGGVIEESGLGVRLLGDLVLEEGRPVSFLDVVTSRTVQVRVDVVRGGAPVGRLSVIARTDDLWSRLLGVLGTGAAAALAAGVLGLAIAMPLQRALTRPLVSLAAAMTRVREAHDYAEACPVESDDEIGQLAGSFNAMLVEIRRRDARLAQHRETLEQEVEDRTRDLVVARDAAESANSAKSEFLATMSHEIRTPMNGMLVMAELLAAGDLPDRQRRYAEVIARSGQSLLAIIDDILDFAKVEAGKLELEALPLDLAETAETVVTLFGERAASKGLDLAAAIDPATPGLVGDPVRLTQVVSNLVNNALKFTQDGHVLVRIGPAAGAVEIAVEDTGIGIPQDKLPTIFSAFSQADQSTTRRYGGTGLGLSIVQRLVTAMGGEIAVTSSVGEGSRFVVRLPLGEDAPAVPLDRTAEPAAVVIAAAGGATRQAFAQDLAAAGFAPTENAEAADAHWIVDAADLVRTGRPAGARRVLALAPIGERAGERALAAGLADALLRRPLAQSEWRVALGRLARAEDFPAASASSAATAAALPRFPGARVLVADDSPVNREVACEALARLGIAADTVEDGRLAVEAVAARRYDLVLMDGSMPEMDGFEAARAIRARDAETGGPRTTIVALTAHVVGSGADAWRTSGMDGVLHKPFTIAKLAEVLAAHLTPSGEEDAIALDAPALAAPAMSETAPPSSDAAALLDEDTVAQIAEMGALSGAGFLARIVGLYCEHAPPALAALVDAVRDAAAPDAVASAAHSLKSMSLNIGAAALAARLAEIETAAREEGRLPAAEALPGLEVLLADTITTLRERFPDAGEGEGVARVG